MPLRKEQAGTKTHPLKDRNAREGPDPQDQVASAKALSANPWNEKGSAGRDRTKTDKEKRNEPKRIARGPLGILFGDFCVFDRNAA